METLFRVIFWLFFWAVILLGRLVFWLTMEIEVPWEVLGVLYAFLVMGFFGFLLRLERRFSRKTKLLWLSVTLLTAAAVLLLILLWGYFSCGRPGLSQLCGIYAVMAPILSGCICFLVGFLKE